MRRPTFLLLSIAMLGSAFPPVAFGHGGGEASIEVGPDKGVIEISADKSFKLSPEAMRNFGIKSVPYAPGTVVLPKEAVVRTLKEAQIFRLRAGFLKAVDFKTVTKGERAWSIRSDDLRSQDEIVVGGVGFLRIIAAQLGDTADEEKHHD